MPSKQRDQPAGNDKSPGTTQVDDVQFDWQRRQTPAQTNKQMDTVSQTDGRTDWQTAIQTYHRTAAHTDNSSHFIFPHFITHVVSPPPSATHGTKINDTHFDGDLRPRTEIERMNAILQDALLPPPAPDPLSIRHRSS